MPTVVKIKIADSPELREQLDALYDRSTQVEVAQWSLEVAKRILKLYAPSFANHHSILEGFCINKAWQDDTARVYDVRQAGFAIHKLAKQQNEMIICTALRVAGQAVATGHMKEHGMVASDYAIKCCNLACLNDKFVVEQERIWQISELQRILNSND